MNKTKFYEEETSKHIEQVSNYLLYVSKKLESKGVNHDKSKFSEEEREAFIKYTPLLKNTTYGSAQYKKYLQEMKPALDHHYTNNRHHPEHFKNGINDMNLIDIVEMFFDWMAATKRHANGDIYKSIEENKKRFGYDNLLANIFTNTAKEMEWYSLIEEQFNNDDSKDVRIIVYDWWIGICVETDAYKAKFAEKDIMAAKDIILSLVSLGLG